MAGSLLTHAADCIIAKLRQTVGRGSDAARSNSAVLYHYVKALESVQYDFKRQETVDELWIR